MIDIKTTKELSRVHMDLENMEEGYNVLIDSIKNMQNDGMNLIICGIAFKKNEECILCSGLDSSIIVNVGVKSMSVVLYEHVKLLIEQHSRYLKGVEEK